MKILVTGAHGLLGRSLLSSGDKADLLGCGRGTPVVKERPYYSAQLGEYGMASRLLEDLRPDWVIHTAALTDVDRCETERDLARQVNLDLVARLVEACAQTGCGFLQLSTDYVFDGKDGPYKEKDATNPLSYYGQLKLESERLVLEAPIRGLVVRTLWLYGYVPGARLNLVTWPLRALQRGDKLRVVHDQWGNPTSVEDLTQALLALCRSGAEGLYHMGGADFMTRWEMVQRVAETFDLGGDGIEPISTKQARQQALRPQRSGLDSDVLSELLGRRPIDFFTGLRNMAGRPDFRRDFLRGSTG